MDSKRYYWLIPLLVGLLVRVWGLTAPGVWQDEALAHFYALQDPEWILTYCAGPINHPPLYFLLLHGWIGLGSTYSQAWVESLNVIVAMVTLVVFYRWIKFSLGKTWALVLTGLLALHPFHVYYSTELRMYALAGLGLTVVGYFATRLLLHEFHNNLNWLGWSAGGLVAVYSHSFTLLPVVLSGIVLGLHAYRKGVLERWGYSAGALLLLYLPWSVFVLNQAVRISGDYWLPPYRWDYLWTLLLWLGGYIGPKYGAIYYGTLSWGVFIGVLLPLVAGLSRWEKDDVRLVVFMVFWPVALSVLLSVWGQSVFLYRVFFPLLTLFVFLVGRGLKTLPFAVAVVCGLVWSGVLIVETVNLKTNPPNQYTRQVAEWIARHRTDRTTVLHTSGTTYFPSRFYHAGDRNEFYVDGRDHLSVNVSGYLREDLGRYERVLVVYPSPDEPDWLRPRNDVRRRLRKLKLEGYSYSMVELGTQSR